LRDVFVTDYYTESEKFFKTRARYAAKLKKPKKAGKISTADSRLSLSQVIRAHFRLRRKPGFPGVPFIPSVEASAANSGT
jgi:hypothetical protein